MGAVHAVDWACTLCDLHVPNDWVSRATNLHQFCVKLEHCSVETIWMIQKAFGDDAVSAAQIKDGTSNSKMAENLLKVIHFLKICDKQNTWECWACRGHNQKRLVPFSARTRSWSGDSKHYWLFPKLKSHFKRKTFQTIDEIQENMKGQPMVIPTKDLA